MIKSHDAAHIMFDIFLFLKIDSGFSLELLKEELIKSTHNLCYEQAQEKHRIFLCKDCQFYHVYRCEYHSYLHMRKQRRRSASR